MIIREIDFDYAEELQRCAYCNNIAQVAVLRNNSTRCTYLCNECWSLIRCVEYAEERRREKDVRS